jgi:hypothetical protein
VREPKQKIHFFFSFFFFDSRFALGSELNLHAFGFLLANKKSAQERKRNDNQTWWAVFESRKNVSQMQV